MRSWPSANEARQWQQSANMKATSLKDWPKVYQKLKRMRGLSEEERIQLARSLAATPDERWQIHETFLRSHGLFSHWERKAYGFKW